MYRTWLAAALLASTIGLGARAAEGQKDRQALSEAHDKLARRAGEYVTVSKFTTPDGKAMESKGTAKLTLVLGGRFLQEENAGTLLGMPVNGLRLVGYNTEANQFEAVWTYTGSTAMMTLVGQTKDDGRTVEFAASFAGVKNTKSNFTVVYRFADADNFTVELIARTEDGTKGPTLETSYTRKK